MQIYKFKSSETYTSISRPIIIKIKDLKYLIEIFFASTLVYFINLLAINETEIKTSNAWNIKIKPNNRNWLEILIVSENKKFGK